MSFFFFLIQAEDSQALVAVAQGGNRSVSSLGYLMIRVSQVFSVHFRCLSVSMGNWFILQASSCNKCLLLPFPDNFLDNIASLFYTAQPWGTSPQPEDKNAAFFQDSRGSAIC